MDEEIVSADALANEIELMQQELQVKRMLLDDSRKKLQTEVAQHRETRTNLTQRLNENKELQVQLEMSLKAAQNLELENNKNRELLVKLQVQTNTCLTERQLLLDRCYSAELENDKLKNEVMDITDKLKAHETYQASHKIRQAQTESIINDILRQQELLKKEQGRLEAISKEGLEFAAKLSEETQYQAKFVLEANSNRIKMEEQVIRLMSALKGLQRERNSTLVVKPQQDAGNYLNEWRNSQKENEERIKELLEENKKLVEELNVATSQIELLLAERK